MSNYNILFVMRIFKNLLYNFIESFFVLYFLELSYNNIVFLGIYKLLYITFLFVFILLFRNVSKSKNRIIIFRIGIVLELIYLLILIFLREKVVDYVFLCGIFYGISEGFYFSVYDIFESNGVENKNRNKFTGQYIFLKSIISIIFPFIFGNLITYYGFISALFLVFLLVFIMLILSFKYKDFILNKSVKFNFKKYFSNISFIEKRVFVLYVFNGITYSMGAFSMIITLFIINVFNSNFSLGVFSSVFSGISCLLGIIFSKINKKINCSKSILILSLLNVITFLVMVYKCTFKTIVLYYLIQSVFKTVIGFINDTSISNISNLENIKLNKEEYFFGCELALFIGRVISYVLFILMYMYINYMVIFLIIFAIFIFILSIYSIKLQKHIKNIDFNM